MSQVGKHRLYRANALAVGLPAPGAVNSLAHALAGMVGVFGLGHKAGDLATPPLIEFERAFKALPAKFAVIAVHRFGRVSLVL